MMPRSPLLVPIACSLLIALPLGGCGGAPSADEPQAAGDRSGDGAGDVAQPVATDPASSDPDPMPELPSIDYVGPPVSAMLEVMESEPPQYALAISAQVPSGGHEFEFTELATEGERLIVDLRLITPGDDEIVTQALEDLKQRVPLAAAPRGGVVVRVATWQRGTEYLVAPPAQVAAVVVPQQ